jgi:hypothetical protein
MTKSLHPTIMNEWITLAGAVSFFGASTIIATMSIAMRMDGDGQMIMRVVKR